MAGHGIPRVSDVSGKKDEQARQEELQKIEEYNSLVSRVNEALRRQEYNDESLKLTRELLMWNPEFYTIWNHRRRILQAFFTMAWHDAEESHDSNSDVQDIKETKDAPANQKIHDLIQGDLDFLLPLLMKFPKCYWIWNHRAWLLQSTSRLLLAETSLKSWQDELSLVNKMLARDGRNFHGWSYRREIVSEILRLMPLAKAPLVGEDGVAPSLKLRESELAYTEKMIKTNLSNFSAWHYRSNMIPVILDEQGATPSERRQRYDTELDLIHRALFDPSDQSLWFYHQYLMTLLCPSPLDIHREQTFKSAATSKFWVTFTNHDREEILRGEIDFIRDILEDVDDCKWVYQSLLRYAQMYIEVDGGNAGVVTTQELRDWLQKLRQLDPLRMGNWTELEARLKL